MDIRNTDGISATEQIADNLNDKHAKLKARSEELAAALPRLPAAAEDEDTADKLSEFVRQCMAFQKELEATRVDEKAPYLEMERAVDGWAASLAKGVKLVREKAAQLRTQYDIAVAERERKRRQEEERLAREKAEAARAEADRMAREARTKAEAERAAERAAQAEQEAEKARRETLAPTTDLTRTRTNSGVTTSLKSEWTFEVLEARAVPRKYCKPDDSLLRAAVKAAVTPDGKCPLEIKGVRIYLKQFSQVR